MIGKPPGSDQPAGADAIIPPVEHAEILHGQVGAVAADETDIAGFDKPSAQGDFIEVGGLVIADFPKKSARASSDDVGKPPKKPPPKAAGGGGSDGSTRPPRGHGEPPQDRDDGRVVIRRGASTRAREVNEAISALAHAPSEFYVSGNKIVRPELVTITGIGDDEVKTAPGLAEASLATIAGALDRRTKWEVFDRRGNDWQGKNSPKDICEQIAARGCMAKFPPIAGVVAGPAMRPDGSIISALGYDSRSRLYYLADKVLAIDPVPARPTRAQAEEAIDDLSFLISSFPSSARSIGPLRCPV